MVQGVMLTAFRQIFCHKLRKNRGVGIPIYHSVVISRAFPCLNCRNFIGDYKHIFSIQQRKQPLNGIFQQSLLSIQGDQRFRAFVCTWRSQSFPFSASHNDGKNFLFCNIHFLILLIPCSNFVCGSKRHLILSLWGK